MWHLVFHSLNIITQTIFVLWFSKKNPKIINYSKTLEQVRKPHGLILLRLMLVIFNLYIFLWTLPTQK